MKTSELWDVLLGLLTIAALAVMLAALWVLYTVPAHGAPPTYTVDSVGYYAVTKRATVIITPQSILPSDQVILDAQMQIVLCKAFREWMKFEGKGWIVLPIQYVVKQWRQHPDGGERYYPVDTGRGGTVKDCPEERTPGTREL